MMTLAPGTPDPGGDALPQAFSIRPYRITDRAAVRRICADTAWLGGPGGERIPDDWLWAEFWTRYFTDAEPEHTWVVEKTADARVVGYLSGTTDARRPEHYGHRLLPAIARHVWRAGLLRRAGRRRALFAMVRGLLSRDVRLPPGVAAAYPATFHINLLPEARGHGFGTRLFRMFEEELSRLGVTGIHAQSLDVNDGVARFNQRVGLVLVGRRRTRVFQHIERRPITVLTWAKPLRAWEKMWDSRPRLSLAPLRTAHGARRLPFLPKLFVAADRER